MDNSQVAKVYAKALLDAGVESKQTEEFEAELRVVLDVLTNNGDIWNFLISPRVSKKDKLDTLEKAFRGKASDSVVSFLCILARNDRIYYLSDIYYQYRLLNDKLNGVIRAKVQSAVPLSADELGEIKKWFQDFYKLKAEIETSVRPELLGGIVIYFDDKVVDGSILSKLKTIKQSISLHAGEKLISNKNTGAYYEN